MVRADVPGRINIFRGESSHPVVAVQFFPEESAHLFFLALAQIGGHVVENREKVVAVTYFDERTVWLSALPPSLSRDIELRVNSFCQLCCFGAQLRGAGGFSTMLEHSGNESHRRYIPGIHPRSLMQVRADDFEQVFDLAVVAEAVTLLIDLLPVSGVRNEMIERSPFPYLFVEPGEVAGHAQVVLRAAHDCHVIDAVPWSHRFARYIIGGQVPMHVLDEPVLY